jgi:hypothetical protein
MTVPDLQIELPRMARPPGVSPTRLLASALLHLLDRDEPFPLRWSADAFVSSVSAHRAVLETVDSSVELDLRARADADTTFPGAVAALASDPLAVALAVRSLELSRHGALPAWPLIVRHGIAPRVAPADRGRWFG